MTFELFDFHAECPGAAKMAVYPDFENNNEWILEKDGESISSDDEEGMDAYAFERSYLFTVIAYDAQGNEIDRKSQQMHASAPNGTLTVKTPVVPDKVMCGEDLVFTSEKPVNAKSIRTIVGYPLNENEDKWLYQERVFEDDEVTIAKETLAELMPGQMVYVQLLAFAPGYELSRAEPVEVPVNCHDWDEWKVNKKATSAAAGSKTRVCKRDSSHIQDAVIAKNNMTVKANSLTASANKNSTFSASKAFSVKKAKGAVTYSKKSGDKKITVAKNGKVTVRKGLKKGKTYSVSVNVTSAATAEYAKETKKVTLKIKIK
jgi:hypothetical protein